MPIRNLRHARVFLALSELGTPSLAAAHCLVTQPAVSQVVDKIEGIVGTRLFDRTRKGFFLTAPGVVFESRIRRAMGLLDPALNAISPRLAVTATYSQLRALVAMSEAGNFALAARSLGLSQPSVHRAISALQTEAQRPLFERTSFGYLPTRACDELAHATRLAFSEFEQAEAELAEFDGRSVGRIVIGSLPLARSALLPEAILAFRQYRPSQPITVVDGSYEEMLGALRRGEIDFIIGALRSPHPIDDVIQEPLFSDRLSVVARPGHPLYGRRGIAADTLVRQAWVVPRSGAPARNQFDGYFRATGLSAPESITECGSILLMRELLARSDMLGCISGLQADAEIRNGSLVALHTGISWPSRDIGVTFRSNWLPTKSQALLLDLVRKTKPRKWLE